MIQYIKNAFLYAGVDKASFNIARPRIIRENRIMVIVLSAFASLLIFAMIISSYISNGTRKNRTVYELGLMLSICVLILALTLARKYDKAVIPLVYTSYAIYYIYGILIGTITDPTGKTVTFMVFLVFLPTLFIDRPAHSAITTTGYVAIFIILCVKHKTGDVLHVDILDAVVFGLLGVASGVVINHIKVKRFIIEQKLHAISRLDQMTEMQNQNAFKMDITTINDIFQHSLACVYIDANGLHDLNNERGHAEGDKMLKCVSQTVTDIFGSKVTYRIGGDEFVAFAPDMKQSELSDKITEMISIIEDNGFSIAVGYEVVHTHLFDIDEFIKAADFRMQEDKKRYKNRRT